MVESARVGIVVRTKNRPWFLARALGDIAAQEFSGWVAHIVNDGGDPESVRAAIEGLSADVRERITVTHNATSLGRSAAANQGVRALETEFTVIHDDDDLWHTRFLAECVGWLDAHRDDIGVVARTEIVYEAPDQNGGFEETSREAFWGDIEQITFIDLIDINRWVPIGYLYRRALHDRVGFYDEEIHAAEDWDFGLRTLVRHHVGFLAGEPLAFWMHRQGVEGDMGNSMFTLAHEHDRYNKEIRDAALREFAATHGTGLVLYLSRLVHHDVRTIVREELVRELDARPSDMDRIRRRLRRLVSRG